MRLVWVALMAGCGFEGKAAPTPEVDASVIVDGRAVFDVPVGATCWALQGAKNIDLRICTTAALEDREVTASVDLDTDATSSGAELVCAPLVADSEPACAIVAKKLTIRTGVRITAHGGKPLAVLAEEIDLQGTIDVSSRAGVRGAGGTLAQCNTSSDAAAARGGGAGGGYGGGGADGGDEGGQTDSGASGGGTLGDSYRGGCDGSGGSQGGVVGKGGAGGGAVWLSVTGKLTLGPASLVNASGEGGPGGSAPGGGGGGGGSGGLIVLQAGSIDRKEGSQVFANGGAGGGGADDDNDGTRGGESERASSGGGGGAGAHDTGSPPKTGRGGDGARASRTMPEKGQNSDAGAGAGGGGGGFGEIWSNHRQQLGASFISPDPKDVP